MANKSISTNLVILLVIIGFAILLTAFIANSNISFFKPVVKDFTYQDINGQSGHLYQLQDKPVILHFWATWCIPCRDELPKLIEKARVTPEITYFLISVDQNKPAMISFLFPYKARIFDNIIIINDPDMTITMGHFKVDRFPETIILHTDKTVAQHLYGSADWSIQ